MNMVETNIRLISPGNELYLEARRLRVETASSGPEIMQRISGKLTSQIKCACVPLAGSAQGEILAATRAIVPATTVESDDWTATIIDTGQSVRLSFANPQDRANLAQILQRALVLRLLEVTCWWHYDGFRTWFEPDPFATREDVAAYRRYHISSVIIEGAGIGVAVDVGTAFFTTRTVADCFADEDGEGLRDRFESLRQRRQGHKGTLLYGLERGTHKCYFEEFCEGVTCGTTPPLKIHGETYPSLFEYIRQRHPSTQVRPGDSVARVSFPGLDHPQPVPAASLRLRVVNEMLPKALLDADKMAPAERKSAIEKFWQTVGLWPFGPGKPHVAASFWRPPRERVFLLRPPALIFGRGKRVEPPIERATLAYKDWFRERLRGLQRGGVYYTPPTVSRRVFFCAPTNSCREAVAALGEEMCESLTDWTGVEIRPVVMPTYANLEEGMARVQREAPSGVVVFVFQDNDPAAYFEIEYGLKPWRVKRVTTETLEEKYSPAQPFMALGPDAPRPTPQPLKDWRSFVRMCALDVLQKLGCLPWRVEPTSGFEAELSVDVGRDRHQYALSLLVNRCGDRRPDFHLNTIVEMKGDVKHDSINPEVLRESILRIFRMLPRGVEIASLLVFRDGRESGREPEAFDPAFDRLKAGGRLATNTEVALVDVHKTGAMDIRLWEVGEGDTVDNVLEGTAVELDSRSVLLCTTGSATLRKLTADPVLLVGRTESAPMHRIADHFFSSAQHNYSSPGVAQRLSAGLKRTDEELEARGAQEIRIR
jgi:hypothetical protein